MRRRPCRQGRDDHGHGAHHYTKWTDNEGQTRYGCEIVAEQVDFLAKAKETDTAEPKKRRSK